MVIITLQRANCIGCTYCAEQDPQHFCMSKQDGKSSLLHAVNKKGFHTVRLPGDEALEAAQNAAKACPVKIIKVSLVR